MSIKLSELILPEGDRFVVPWYLRGGIRYKREWTTIKSRPGETGQIGQSWWNRYKIMTFVVHNSKNLKRLSGRKASRDLLKQGGPSRDVDGQEVRKRLTIFDRNMTSINLA